MGFRAMAKLLLTYRKKYGLHSIDAVIARWAPPGENPTANYVEFVKKNVGSSVVTDTNMAKVIYWMSRFEGAKDGDFEVQDAEKGAKMALNRGVK